MVCPATRVPPGVGEQHQGRGGAQGPGGEGAGVGLRGLPGHTDLALIIFDQDLARLSFLDNTPDGHTSPVGRGGVQPHMVPLDSREKTWLDPCSTFPFLLCWGRSLRAPGDGGRDPPPSLVVAPQGGMGGGAGGPPGLAWF